MLNLVIRSRILDQKKKKIAMEKEVNRKNLKATKRSGDEKHSKVNHTGW